MITKPAECARSASEAGNALSANSGVPMQSVLHDNASLRTDMCSWDESSLLQVSERTHAHDCIPGCRNIVRPCNLQVTLRVQCIPAVFKRRRQYGFHYVKGSASQENLAAAFLVCHHGVRLSAVWKLIIHGCSRQRSSQWCVRVSPQANFRRRLWCRLCIVRC